jgi:hypothetical protein
LLTLLDAQRTYSAPPLLDRAAFSVEAGKRIGFIGRNGTSMIAAALVLRRELPAPVRDQKVALASLAPQRLST